MELLSGWLPSRPWFEAAGGSPDLVKAGGFRLDDPAGEVGLEFMVALDSGGERPVAYHVPLTYRGSPLDDAEDALIGTAEHGVLGLRWVYDGTRDPVLLTQLTALLHGGAEPQAQSITDTPDPTVLVEPLPGACEPPARFTASDDADGTVIRTGNLTVRVHRVLRPVTGSAARPGSVTATWRPDGDTQVRGVFVSAEPARSS